MHFKQKCIIVVRVLIDRKHDPEIYDENVSAYEYAFLCRSNSFDI